jgi:hypothetical protein
MCPASNAILSVLRQVKVGYWRVVRRLTYYLLAHWVLNRSITITLWHRCLLDHVILLVTEGSSNLVIVRIRYLSKYNIQLLGGRRLFDINWVGQTSSSIFDGFFLFRLLLLFLLERVQLSVVDAFALAEFFIEHSYVLLPLMHSDLVQNEWVIHREGREYFPGGLKVIEQRVRKFLLHFFVIQSFNSYIARFLSCLHFRVHRGALLLLFRLQMHDALQLHLPLFLRKLRSHSIEILESFEMVLLTLQKV